MAEIRDQTHRISRNISAESLDSPAIGIVSTPETTDNALPGAIVRSLGKGHHVLVTTAEEGSEQLSEIIEQVPVTFVEPEVRPQDVTPIEHLSGVARERGFPGLIHHESVSAPIDFEQSVEAVLESDEYCVSAISASNRDDGAHVVAGIFAYNEEVGIGSVVHSARAIADDVIVVDDGSSDDTARIARQAGAQVLHHAENKGKGAAIQTLLDNVKTRRFDAVVLLDGDGQHVPSNIPRVVKPVIDGEADMVIGSRYLEGSEYDETPRYRRIGQRVLDALTFGTSKAQVSDSQSGFRALSPAAVDRISIKTEGFGAESEMIDSAVRNGLSITERPVDVRYKDIEGHTRNPLKHGLEVVAFLMYLVRDRHPLLFFGVPGSIVTIAGVLYGLDGILIYQNTGQFYPGKVFASGFLTIIGVLSMFVGLILNQVSNMISRLDEDLA